MQAHRALFLLAVIAPAVITTGCASTQSDGVQMGGTNKTESSHRRKLVEEMRYMHGQELLARMHLLARMGEDAGPELREAVHSEDWLVRSSVMWILGAIGDRYNIPALHEGLKDGTPAVRYQAAASLVKLGDEQGYPVLVEGLADKDIELRFKCIQTLRAMRQGQDFGYRHDASPAERSTALVRWREWLAAEVASGL